MDFSSLLVRHADIADAPMILDIFLESEVQTDFKGGITLASVLDWIECSNDKFPLLVVCHEDNIIGWCASESFYGLPSMAGVAEVAIYIKAAWHRLGIGAWLLHYLSQYSMSHDLHTFVAHILEANISSQHFFLRQGYEQWGRLPNVARSGGIQGDLILLGRQIELSH
ncbi:GNAT family N-acetyltransferase [Marinomonas ostreistagni]|uniref:GNAT family N-acetyltransferase n=1 Tax=Marinomonas ostreistagni TaxID=359209 RepID=A0ABS0ZAF9_9GAMM|nr:GNAT family N-acetyltransferase [Marinomonas ostreistagni]MBJ7550646.1 GNAT family N-acetyltransferase [Marinomonas ostreistagni]